MSSITLTTDYKKQLSGINAIRTKLNGAYIITNEVYKDFRGCFRETFNLKNLQKIIGPYEFVQDCHSISKKNVIRGLHYQIERPQGKLVQCVRGEIYDVIVDLRQSSKTFGHWTGFHLFPGSSQLWIPPGFAHGFSVLSDEAEVLYKVTDYYYPEHERTLLWNDISLVIDWGVDTPILSDKDMNGTIFFECDKYE
jgi:dTDP-4-dehydrorhamnose 3,5-epimerase